MNKINLPFMWLRFPLFRKNILLRWGWKPWKKPNITYSLRIMFTCWKLFGQKVSSCSFLEIFQKLFFIIFEWDLKIFFSRVVPSNSKPRALASGIVFRFQLLIVINKHPEYLRIRSQCSTMDKASVIISFWLWPCLFRYLRFVLIFTLLSL